MWMTEDQRQRTSTQPAHQQQSKYIRHQPVDRQHPHAHQNGCRRQRENCHHSQPIKHIGGAKEPYFTAASLERAFVAARTAKEKAEQASQKKYVSPGDELANQK